MFTDVIPVLLAFGILCCGLAAAIARRKESAAAPRERDTGDILRGCREGLEKVRFEMEL